MTSRQAQVKDRCPVLRFLRAAHQFGSVRVGAGFRLLSTGKLIGNCFWDPHSEQPNLLRNRTQAHGRSMNEDLKELLAVAMGVQPLKTDEAHNPFDRFRELWNEEERASFDATLADNRRIDNEEWK